MVCRALSLELYAAQVRINTDIGCDRVIQQASLLPCLPNGMAVDDGSNVSVDEADH